MRRGWLAVVGVLGACSSSGTMLPSLAHVTAPAGLTSQLSGGGCSTSLTTICFSSTTAPADLAATLDALIAEVTSVKPPAGCGAPVVAVQGTVPAPCSVKVTDGGVVVQAIAFPHLVPGAATATYSGSDVFFGVSKA